MTVIPTAWRDKLTDWRYKLAVNYLPEVFVVILACGAGWFGAAIIAAPADFARLASFAQAFKLVPSQWWGMAMVVLSVLMVALLVHSRAAAAVPTFLLGIVWVAWVLPIAFSPNFAVSAPIAYTIIATLTLAAGAACLVERGQTHGGTQARPADLT